MTPVDQVVLEPGQGDSLAACIASILEVPLAEVGDLDQGNNLEQLEGVLALKGLGFCFMAGRMETFRVPTWAEPNCVVVGGSPRTPAMGHAVVGQVLKDATGIELVHDPHPDRAFVVQPWRGCLVLFRLDELGKRLTDST